MSRRLGMLISGRGSNLQSVIEATRRGDLQAEIAVVISNRPEAAGLMRARDAGIETVCLLQKDYASRELYDSAVAQVLQSHRVDLVCLAGFMRLIGEPILTSFPNRILNMHPSLLPAFPGLDAQKQALEHGVRVAGATIHLVDSELDSGAIILQAAVPVLDTDTVESLSARILVEEHRLYPRAIALVLDGKWRLVGRRFLVDVAASGA